MINVHEYFAINWEATAKNIKNLLSHRASNKALADFMCVDERTIRNWYNCEAKPSLNVLVLIAKICNTDLLDILVLNGQTSESISKADVDECFEKVEQVEDIEVKVSKRYKECDCHNEEMIRRDVIINEFIKQSYPINKLDEFLLILPLINIKELCDVLYRINGNIGKNKDYVLEQLKYLYDSIPNDAAKDFVEFYREYFLTYPSLRSIIDPTSKLKKSEEVVNMYKSEAYEKMYNCYQEKHENFLELLLASLENKADREFIED